MIVDVLRMIVCDCRCVFTIAEPYKYTVWAIVCSGLSFAMGMLIFLFEWGSPRGVVTLGRKTRRKGNLDVVYCFPSLLYRRWHYELQSPMMCIPGWQCWLVPCTSPDSLFFYLITAVHSAERDIQAPIEKVKLIFPCKWRILWFVYGFIPFASLDFDAFIAKRWLLLRFNVLKKIHSP